MTGLVLLAAGASTRLGEPKQQLPYQGTTLLQHAIHTALDSVCKPVVVVLGAKADELLTVPDDARITKVKNHQHQEGMASSIRCGLAQMLTQAPNVTACIFMVCDQPFVSPALLKKLVRQKQESEAGIVASAYENTLGTPVLFDRRYFPELLDLQGQEGAKKVVMRYRQDVVAVPFPEGSIDIDTAEDYAALLKKS